MDGIKKIRVALNVALLEIESFHKLITQRRFSEIDRLDWLHGLTRPNGNGEILLGRKGAAALQEAAHLIWQNDKTLRRRINARIVETEVERRFSQALATGEKFTPQFVADFIKETLAAVRKGSLTTLTHVIPCILSYDTVIDDFTVGPVRFLTASKFLQEYDARLTQHTDETRRLYIEQHRNRALKNKPTSLGVLPSWPRLQVEEGARMFENDARTTKLSPTICRALCTTPDGLSIGEQRSRSALIT